MNFRGGLICLSEFIASSENNKIEFEVAYDYLVKQSNYEDLKKNYRETQFNIFAFAFFLKKCDRDTLLIEIRNKPWLHKHEILTRWAWMCAQEKHIKNGVVFNKPYRCKVGQQLGRRKVDREFEIFRMFLPHYHMHTGKKLLFIQKLENPDDPPDFVAEEENGTQLGIEVTEVPFSKYIKEAQAKRKVFEKLGYWGNHSEDIISESSLRLIIQKINKKKKPSINPCILVMYDNTKTPMPDFKEVAKLIRKKIDPKGQAVFKEIWLTDYKKAKLLL